MRALYGSLIIFFYFVKYPVVIYLAAGYLYLDLPSNIIMDMLGVISLTLIIKDLFFTHKRNEADKGIKT